MNITSDESSFLAEHRKTKRHRVYGLAAYEHASGERLGSIKDISGLGFRLLGKRQIRPGKTYRLWLEIPHWTNGKKQRVLLDAQCVWFHCMNGGEPSYYLTGFHVTDATPEAEARIANIGAES